MKKWNGSARLVLFGYLSFTASEHVPFFLGPKSDISRGFWAGKKIRYFSVSWVIVLQCMHAHHFWRVIVRRVSGRSSSAVNLPCRRPISITSRIKSAKSLLISSIKRKKICSVKVVKVKQFFTCNGRYVWHEFTTTFDVLVKLLVAISKWYIQHILTTIAEIPIINNFNVFSK